MNSTDPNRSHFYFDVKQNHYYMISDHGSKPQWYCGQTYQFSPPTHTAMLLCKMALHVLQHSCTGHMHQAYYAINLFMNPLMKTIAWMHQMYTFMLEVMRHDHIWPTVRIILGSGSDFHVFIDLFSLPVRITLHKIVQKSRFLFKGWRLGARGVSIKRQSCPWSVRFTFVLILLEGASLAHKRRTLCSALLDGERRCRFGRGFVSLTLELTCVWQIAEAIWIWFKWSTADVRKVFLFCGVNMNGHGSETACNMLINRSPFLQIFLDELSIYCGQQHA